MTIAPFTGQYEAAALLAGRDRSDLEAGDEARSLPWHRWLAVDPEPVAMVTAFLRPDDRWFLSFDGAAAEACNELVATAASAIEKPLHTTVDAASTVMVRALEGAGFTTQVVNDRFRVAFVDVLPVLQRSWLPSRCHLIGVADADPDRLFILDNELRGSVPGVDGWRGDRALFDDELTDPAAYAVAVCDSSYVGLARIWNNPEGPSFGLVGVVPERRETTIAGALLTSVLSQAATWGFDSFTTGTSRTNTAVHPHLARLGTCIGTLLQMVRT